MRDRIADTQLERAVVVAQLEERLLPIQEDQGLNLIVLDFNVFSNNWKD